MGFCILCGAKGITDANQAEHERSEEHQLAGVKLLLATVDEAGCCPYCKPTKRGRPRRLSECRDKDHVAKITACRGLLAARKEG